jgi:hypothetical protein
MVGDGYRTPTRQERAAAFIEERAPIRTVSIVSQDWPRLVCSEKNVGNNDSSCRSGLIKWSSGRSLASSITHTSGGDLEEDSDDDDDDEEEDIEELQRSMACFAQEESSTPSKRADCKPFIPTRQQSERRLDCDCDDEEDVLQDTGSQKESSRRCSVSRSVIDSDSPPTKPRRSFSFASDGGDSDDEDVQIEAEVCAKASIMSAKLAFSLHRIYIKKQEQQSCLIPFPPASDKASDTAVTLRIGSGTAETIRGGYLVGQSNDDQYLSAGGCWRQLLGKR